MIVAEKRSTTCPVSRAYCCSSDRQPRPLARLIEGPLHFRNGAGQQVASDDFQWVLVSCAAANVGFVKAGRHEQALIQPADKWASVWGFDVVAEGQHRIRLIGARRWSRQRVRSATSASHEAYEPGSEFEFPARRRRGLLNKSAQIPEAMTAMRESIRRRRDQMPFCGSVPPTERLSTAKSLLAE